MSNSRTSFVSQLIGFAQLQTLNLPSEPTDLEIVRFACQEYFICYCVAVMDDFLPTKFHCWLADKLQRSYERVKRGEDVRLIIEVQPQIGKSRMVSELFLSWLAGKEKWPLVCASYGASLAERKSETARKFVDSEVFHWIFPNVKLDQSTTSKEYWKTLRGAHGTAGASYRAVGVGGGLTGMPGKFMICDDPFKDRADADSQLIRDNTWNWWNSVFYTRRQSPSGLILVNTRWHLEDIAGRLEEQQRINESVHGPDGVYDRWEKISFPAIAEEDEYLPDLSGKPKLFRKVGEVLCPERFTLEDMTKTKNAYAAVPGGIMDWASLFMQKPIIAENAEFRRGWFKYWEPEDIKGLRGYKLSFVDLAVSQKKSADNVVVRTIFFEYDRPNWYLLDETAGHLDPLATIDAMFWHFEQHRSKFYVESVGYQAALQYFLLEEMRKRKVFFTVEELKVKTRTSKEERIRGLIPLYKAGCIYHRKGQDEPYEIELLSFPKASHDDRIDTVSMALGVAKHTPKNMDEQQVPGQIKKKVVDPGFDPTASFQKV